MKASPQNIKNKQEIFSEKDHGANNPDVHKEEKNDVAPTENRTMIGERGKDIRHYIFEFVLVFLAVFCGFIAENWRVKLDEHQREKVYIRSIVEDLKSDTLQSTRIMAQLRTLKSGIDSVLVLMSSPEILENSNDAFKLWTKSLGLEVFASNDRTIQQLKNSGDLRLIRNEAVSDRIMEYDQILKKYNVQSDLMYDALSNVSYYGQLFDIISLVNDPDTPVPLTDQGKKTLNQAYANLLLWGRGLTGLIGWLDIVHKEGVELVEFIEAEYQFK